MAEEVVNKQMKVKPDRHQIEMAVKKRNIREIVEKELDYADITYRVNKIEEAGPDVVEVKIVMEIDDMSAKTLAQFLDALGRYESYWYYIDYPDKREDIVVIYYSLA